MELTNKNFDHLKLDHIFKDIFGQICVFDYTTKWDDDLLKLSKDYKDKKVYILKIITIDDEDYKNN